MPRPSDVSVRDLVWPDGLPPLEHPDFERQLTKWLLGLLPASVARQAVARRHLDVLLHLGAEFLAGSVEGLRSAYATARAELGESHAPETVAASLAAIAAVGMQVGEELAFINFVRSNRGD